MKRKFKMSAIGRRNNADSNSNGSGWFLNDHFGHVQCFFMFKLSSKTNIMKKKCQLTLYSASAEKNIHCFDFSSRIIYFNRCCLIWSVLLMKRH